MFLPHSLVGHRVYGQTPHMTERYFYHSFPQHSNSDDATMKGLAIVESMARHGFLLTPEVTRWSEYLESGDRSEEVFLAQKSVSFTELEPAELPRHADRYGPFAFEFPVPALLELGALPVIYLPPPQPLGSGMGGVGASLLMRLGEVQRLLELLSDVVDLPDDGTNLVVTRGGVASFESSISIADAQEFIRMLELQSQPVSALVNSLRAFLGLVYPTTDLDESDDELKHYREREWRIVGGAMHSGKEVHQQLDDEAKDAILRIDPVFFGAVEDYRSGPSRRVDLCQLFQDLDGRHVLSRASRCIVPSEAVSEAEAVLLGAGLDVDVVSLDSI